MSCWFSLFLIYIGTRSLDFWSRCHGHRMIPVELGDMNRGGMKEKIISLQEFVSLYLDPSTNMKCWSLEEATSNKSKSKIAYLAQHPMFEQTPSLLKDIDPSPSLCGTSGPTHVNVWLGTGGTRTPLHFDSYDNLFVQLVGAKYIRIYSTSETGRLYVIR